MSDNQAEQKPEPPKPEPRAEQKVIPPKGYDSIDWVQKGQDATVTREDRNNDKE